MTLPNVNLTIEDGALGQLPPSTENIHTKIGVSSAGPVNTLLSFGDSQLLRDTLGQGPLVESAAHSLDVAGGPVLCMRVSASIPGAVGTITKSGNGTGGIFINGTPNDAYAITIQITRDGVNAAAATGAFKLSLDGGINFTAELAIPTSTAYLIADTGLTIGFANGASGTSFAAGDTYTAACTAPGYSATDLAQAFTALLADPREWGFAHVVGAPATPALAAGLAASAALFMQQAEANYRYAFALLEAPDATDAALMSAFQSFASPRVMVAAGYEELSSSISGRTYKRSAAWPIAARIAKVPIKEDLGRVASGSLPGVESLVRNEEATPGLDAARFATLRTIVGLAGFYVTNGRTMATLISDFQLVQFRRVMDRACQIARVGCLRFLNDDLRIDPVTGVLNELDARAIENVVSAQLVAGLVSTGFASAASIVLKRDANILSTGRLPVRVRVLPLGYAKFIDIDIGFTNPALQAKAA